MIGKRLFIDEFDGTLTVTEGVQQQKETVVPLRAISDCRFRLHLPVKNRNVRTISSLDVNGEGYKGPRNLDHRIR